MINIAILGYGVVGSGVAEIIEKNKNNIAARAGQNIQVKRILDIKNFPDAPHKELITDNPDHIFKDKTISLVVETIGGTRAAYEFTKNAFMCGKHVVSSNKELVAAHGPELLKLAKKNRVNYMFEASVGGGIPIIRPLSRCLSANRINSITGILNGTTNYILTRMKVNGESFEDALKDARQKGYAEADPTADIEGHDACRKIAILSSIAYNEFVDASVIKTEGISKITMNDMEFAEAINSTIKLLALSRYENGKIYCRVAPGIIKKTHPLAGVDDVFNAVLVNGDAIGDAMFYGQGAGKLPTASAVIADVIDIVHDRYSVVDNVWVRPEKSNLVDIANESIRLFARFSARNREAAKQKINKVMGKVEYIELKANNEIAFITDLDLEGKLRALLASLRGSSEINKVENIIAAYI